jgi:hypothetical protein
MKTVVLSMPMFGFVVATRAALGAGIGLLLSKKIPESRRKAIGLTLVTIGAETTVPALMAIRRRLNDRGPTIIPPDRGSQTAEVPI